MKHFIQLLMAASIALAGQMAHAQLAFPVPRPDVKVGDRWKVLSLDGLSKLQEDWLEQTVSEIDDRAFTIVGKTSAGAQPDQRYDRDWNAFQDVKGKQELQVRVVFPLEVGKTWDTKYEWINPRGHHGRMEMSFKVGSAERITVPAGTFDAVPIDGRGYWYNLTTGSSGAAIEKRWYAPSARAMIRRTWVTRNANGTPDQNRLFELQEVQLAP